MVCLLARVAFNCQPLSPYISAGISSCTLPQVLAFHVDAYLVREHLLCLWTLLYVGVLLVCLHALFTPAVGMLATVGLPSSPVCGTYPPCLECCTGTTIPWFCPCIRLRVCGWKACDLYAL